MRLTPIKTRRLEPLQDSLLAVLDEVLPALQDKDILVIASKVVAIDEGRFVADAESKRKLIESESDHIIKAIVPKGWDITVKNDMISFAGGVDESNIGGGLLLLPKDPNASARRLREYLMKKFGLSKLGVIISDSSALPYREGVITLSIGHTGFEPVISHVGHTDLFGRPFGCTKVDAVDAIAAAAGFVMGETDESTPLCLVRDIPHIVFTDEDRSADLRIKATGDIFYPLLKGTYKNN